MTAALDRYVALFDFAPAGYVAIDVDGKIAEVNHLGADLLATERDGMRGRRIESFFAPDSRPAVSGLLARIRTTGGKGTCTARTQGSGGEPRILRIVATASPEGEFTLLAMIDSFDTDP